MANIVTIGEILLRLTPESQNRLHQGGNFNTYYGGAEANVAVSLKNFGHNVSFLSAVPPHDIGNAALKQLRKEGVDTTWVYCKGKRMGIYYYEPGYSLKQAKVIYDREASSFLSLPDEKINWDIIYNNIDVLHTTGITPALSYSLNRFTLTAIKEAKKRNIQVSFDFNYRSKLWSPEKAKTTFLEILPYVDICFAGFKDFAFLLGNNELTEFDEDYLKKNYKKFANKYDITYFSCTNRTVRTSTRNEIEGYFFKDNTLYKSSSFTFSILDRIGSGDAFAAGILHGILSNMSEKEIVEFGTGSCVMKHFIYGDSSQFNAEEVKEFTKNQNQDVNR